MLRSRTALIALLALLVVGAGVLTGLLATEDDPKVTTPEVLADGRYRIGTVEEGQDALKAAVAALPVALSYDYRSLDTSLEKAVKAMTSGFGDEFRRTFEATTRELATDKQAITSALVRGAGVVEASDSRATVLVYLDQVLIASKAKKPDDPLKVSQNRVRVDLSRVDGAWKIAAIEPF